MDDFERTEAGNLTDEGIRQYLLAKFNRVTKIKDKRIKDLEERINLAIGGIDALSGNWDELAKEDVKSIKLTLEQSPERW